MYIERIQLENVKTFERGDIIEFIHPDREWSGRNGKTSGASLPEPKLDNVTLILGDNGAGKTTLLQGLAASAFGPAAKDLLNDGALVRFGAETGQIHARLRLHEQEGAHGEKIDSSLVLNRKGERLFVEAESSSASPNWGPVYESRNDAFFVVGYGATRRVEYLEHYDAGARAKSRAGRDQRVMSLFEPSYSLIPLASWLPQLQLDHPQRYEELAAILDRVLKPGRVSFTGRRGGLTEKQTGPSGDYLFLQGEMEIPFQCLSDGYRAFIGWVGDLLHHICFGCPSDRRLADSRGVVLVDEIDLHLHPSWQQKVVHSVATAFPQMQFIMTSHSPLVVGSLEWMNLVLLKSQGKQRRTTARRHREGIHGLDADQILLSKFFGLKTTRTPARERQLEKLRIEARAGDDAAAPLTLTSVEPATDQ